MPAIFRLALTTAAVKSLLKNFQDDPLAVENNHYKSALVSDIFRYHPLLVCHSTLAFLQWYNFDRLTLRLPVDEQHHV